jgi:ABC-type branched-subunit amino acid transport system permease subunit
VVYIVVQDRILTANLEIGTLKLSLSSLHLLLYGGLLVLIILFEPKGIVGLQQRLTRWWKRRTGGVMAGKAT